MLSFVFRVLILISSLFGISNAQNNDTQNIVDIVDYRFNSIRVNINGDISKIKTELEKIKELQSDKRIENEILNIDRSIKSLENELKNSISDTEAFEKEYKDGLNKYNDIVIRQDKKIEKIDNTLNTLGVGILLIGLFTALISFVFIRIFVRKAKQNTAKEVNEIFNKWLNKKELHEQEELSLQNQLQDQIEYWQNRYEELKSDDKKFFDEFKIWSKNIEDKELKNRIKKYIKKFQKEKNIKK